MAVNQGPQISKTGLVSYYDAGNINSFRGIGATNLMYGVFNSYSNTNDTYFKTFYGTESAFIPYFNRSIDVKYVDIYNDYNGGSNNCCPSPFYYNSSTLTVSGNTTYMYQIIFKTDNGYYNPNYMYRYEYTSSGTYVTEGGLVNGSRLESLGDGWFHAWGQFTTNASTALMNCYLFHYEYVTWNRIRVAAVSLTQGTTIHRPEHLLNLNYRATRGSTVAAGGGFKDVIGTGAGELFNGVTIDNSYGTSLFFDGTNDYINIGSDTATNVSPSTKEFTIEVLFRVSASHVRSNPSAIFDRYRYGLYYNYTSNYAYFVYVNKTFDDTGSYAATTTNSATLNSKGQVNHVVFTYTGTGDNGSVSVYTNGTLTSTNASTRISNYPLSTGYIGNSEHQGGTVYYFEGYLYFIKIYNRILIPSEVARNYNSLRGRMSLVSNSNTILVRPTANSLGTNSLFSSTLLYLDPANKQSFTTGQRFWYDLSSNKRRVTLYSNGGTTYRLSASAAPTWSSEGKGTFVFDGVNDFGRLDTEITTTTNFTVSVWVKTTASGDRGIFSHCSGGPVGMGYSVETYMKYWYYSGQWYTLTGNTIINDGTWKNLVWVTTGTNFKMYVNGVLDREATLVATVITLMRSVGSLWGPCSSDSYGVGTDYYSSVFSGSMGPLIAWNRALSASEVVQLYDNFKSRYTTPYIPTNGLQLYLDAGNTTSYPGTGLTWFDISGNSRNFTLDSGFTYRSSGNLFMTDGIGAVRDGVITTSTTSTIILWLKTTDTQALFIHGQDGGYYVGAYYSTAKEYHQSAGSPDFYLDSAARDNIFDFGLDGKWHMYEFRNVNLQNWASFKFNKYSSFTFGSVNIGAIMIYSKNLSSAESQLIYNTMKTRFSNTPTIVTNGLVIHIDAGDYSSYPGTGTTWSDLSGNGVNGTLINGPAFDTGNGGSLTFDGTNDYVSLSNSLLVHRTSNWAYSCWVNFSGAPSYGTIFENGSWVNCILIRFETNGIAIYSMSQYWGKFSFAPSFARWYKLDFVREGNTIYFYINGLLSSTMSFSADIQPSSNLFIGGSQHTTGQHFQGKIASVQIYNRALPTLEILQNYKATRARFGLQHVTESLIVHLDASDRTSYQSSGTTWLDISGNGNHFRLYNGASYNASSGGYIDFDGINDYVASISNLNLTSYDYIAVEIFYKSNNTNTGSMLFEHTSSWNSNTGGFGLALNSNGNTNVANMNHTNHNTEVARNYEVTNNLLWNNSLNLFSRISDATGRLAYSNSSLVSFTSVGGYGTTTATTANGSFANAILYIGSRGGVSEFFNGSVGSIKIYGYKISQDDITRNFNAERWRFGI